MNQHFQFTYKLKVNQEIITIKKITAYEYMA